MMPVDPAWIAQISNDKGGEDFLGLRATQAGMTGYLLPGINTITPRARYYVFYSWVVVEYEQGHPPGWSLERFLRRREQIFALANIADAFAARGDPYVAGLAGSDRLSSHWNEHRETGAIPLEAENVVKYLAASYGGFDAYRRALYELHILGSAPDASTILKILPHADTLAAAFAQAIRGTRYFARREELDTAQSVPVDILIEYGRYAGLNHLAGAADCAPLLEILFAFEARTQHTWWNDNTAPRANMHGSLGMILEMQQMTKQRLSDERFRRIIAFARTDDFVEYTPSPELQLYAAGWQLFQLREYYVYAIYALWRYFLEWLAVCGPATLTAFDAHCADALRLHDAAQALGVELPQRTAAEWLLADFIDCLLAAAGSNASDRRTRTAEFARKSAMPLNEHQLYLFLRQQRPADPGYLGAVVLLLTTLYLRLAGLRDFYVTKQPEAWAWGAAGDAKRRPLDLFVVHMESRLHAGATIHDLVGYLVRDYVVAQHLVVALEKWRERQVNTFHFDYDGATFTWLKRGTTGFSASRFEQAYTILGDLGLFTTLPESGAVQLTDFGQATWRRAKEACGA
jgi:hypothetical protein